MLIATQNCKYTNKESKPRYSCITFDSYDVNVVYIVAVNT